MARQKGIFPIQGTIGNVTFLKSKHGYLARERGGVDAAKIANDPRFQRTRENNAEFGRAGKAGKLLRDAFRVLLQKASDSSVVSRLTKEMMKVIKLDATSMRGMRNVLDGELEALQGFETNSSSKLSALFYAAYTATIDRVTGKLTITIPPFVPATMIGVPTGATHFCVHAGGAEINFESGQINADVAASANLHVGNDPTLAISLEVEVTPNSTQPLFLAMAIEFLQQVNGAFYPIKNGSFNAMAFVKIAGV